MATVITSEDVARLHQHFATRSRASVAEYFGYVVINSDPPRMWDLCIEDWQVDILAPMVPAVEQMVGMRSDYAGPRRFWYTLPRGHDKTGFIARLVNWAVGFSPRKISASASAGDKDQARLIADACEREIALNPWLGIKAHNYEVKGPGGVLEILAADAPTASGRTDDLIVCDEITYWSNRDLFDMLLSGAHKRPNSVVVVITNAGIRGSWQWDVLQAAKADPLWKVYEAPHSTKLAGWLKDAEIASARAMMSRGHARRVFDNIWTDASDSPLLSWDDIEGCHGKPLWKDRERGLQLCEGDLFIGGDIGRTKHRSVIATLELVKRRAVLRELFVMHNAPFDKQEDAFALRINHPRVKAVRIDKGGIGMPVVERLERRFPGKVKGIACSPQWQGQAALKMVSRFRQKLIEVPNDPELNSDLQMVEEVGTAPGGLPILKTHENELGHADRFWSIALGIDAMPIDAGPKPVAPKAAKSRFA